MHVPPHELYEISTLMDDLYGGFRFWPIQIRILLFASRAVTGDTHFGSGTTGDSMVTKRDLAAFVRQLDILNRVELKQTCLLISRFHTLQHHLEFLSLVPWHFPVESAQGCICWTMAFCEGRWIFPWPGAGPQGGRPFQHRFALVECRGDWKWHRELWDFKRHYKAIDICHACFATKNHGPYQHLGFNIYIYI